MKYFLICVGSFAYFLRNNDTVVVLAIILVAVISACMFRQRQKYLEKRQGWKL